MICEILFPEFSNLYGDSANMTYFQACAPDMEFCRTHNRQTPRFVTEDVDMIYLGSMSEANQKTAVERLRPHRDRLRELVERGTVVLATGNACELFGSAIYDSREGEIPMLGMFDFSARRDLDRRHNSMFLGSFAGDQGEMTIVGSRSQFSCLEGDFPGDFIRVVGGRGNHVQCPWEGYRYRNLFGTYLLGPFLVLNPPFTRYLLRLLGREDTLAFQEEAMDAYRLRCSQMQQEGFPFDMGAHG